MVSYKIKIMSLRKITIFCVAKILYNRNLMFSKDLIQYKILRIFFINNRIQL